jgi:hypothetical protein
MCSHPGSIAHPVGSLVISKSSGPSRVPSHHNSPLAKSLSSSSNPVSSRRWRSRRDMLLVSREHAFRRFGTTLDVRLGVSWRRASEAGKLASGSGRSPGPIIVGVRSIPSLLAILLSFHLRLQQSCGRSGARNVRPPKEHRRRRCHTELDTSQASEHTNAGTATTTTSASPPSIITTSTHRSQSPVSRRRFRIASSVASSDMADTLVERRGLRGD